MWPSVILPGTDILVLPYDDFRLLAQVSAISLATILNRRRGVAAWKTIAVALICLPFGYWGSRFLDVFEYRSAYSSLEAALGRSGSSIYGGLIAAIAVGALACRLLAIRLGTFFDGAGPAVALAEAVTRLGCFTAGCCYGIPWNGPLAVSFPRNSFAFDDLVHRGLLDPSAPRSLAVHPVQLYAAGLMFVCTAWLVHRHAQRPSDGEVFASSLIIYGTQRLLLSPFRIEQLASMKALSVLFIVSGVLGIVWCRRRGWSRAVATS
jgi:phosphatidylglycerol---prolipoprotein diacylglyceryl transferase